MIPEKLEAVKDERGVSPVIGVILMVAITVILAAVIGTFVLGLGNQVGETGPQASLSVSDANEDYTGSGSTAFIVQHSSGADISASEMEIIVRFAGNGTQVDKWSGGDFAGPLKAYLNGESSALVGEDVISTGDSIVIKDDSGSAQLSSNERYEIQIVHVPSGQSIASSTVKLR